MVSEIYTKQSINEVCPWIVGSSDLQQISQNQVASCGGKLT
jgi:hypothetical protein